MESTIVASTQPQVIVGVDTHKQFHVAHAVDQLGRPLGTHRLAATPAGYRGFVSWAHELGQLVAVGIEGLVISVRVWPATFARRASRSAKSGVPNGSAVPALANRTTLTRPEPPRWYWPATPLASLKAPMVPRKWCGCCESLAPAWCAPGPRPTTPSKTS
jgi:hypothetical protein